MTAQRADDVRWTEATECSCNHPGCDPEYGHFGTCLPAPNAENYWRDRALRAEADLERFKLALIEAQNPGIDMERVKAQRAAHNDGSGCGS